MASNHISRDQWPEVVQAFTEFLGEFGDVEATEDSVTFSAPSAGTGLALSRDGTSSSFMPLHEMGGLWARVGFVRDPLAVVIEGDGFSYTYRVPGSLVKR